MRRDLWARPPSEFKALRPITILLAAALVWSKVCFLRWERYDVITGPSQMGFRKHSSCVESIAAVRALLERRADRGEATTAGQLGLARACDSAWHTALRRSMRHRKVPRPLALANVREAACMARAFQHNDWETGAVTPRVGLRQGCSASPMFFWCVFQDGLQALEAYAWK